MITNPNNFIRQNSRILFWASFLLTMFALFMPSYGDPKEVYNLDIAIHYIMFLVFGAMSMAHFFRKQSASAMGVLLILVLFIPASEFIQENFVAGRGYEFTDILSGYAGILTAYLVIKKSKAGAMPPDYNGQ